MKPEEIVSYIMNSPWNTNPNLLLEFLADGSTPAPTYPITLKFVANYEIDSSPQEYEYEVGLSGEMNIMAPDFTPAPPLVVEGWYLNPEFTERVVFPYKAQNSQTFYANVVQQTPKVFVVVEGTVPAEYPWTSTDLTCNGRALSLESLLEQEIGEVSSLIVSGCDIEFLNSSSNYITCVVTTNLPGAVANPTEFYTQDSSALVNVSIDPGIHENVYINLKFTPEI